MFDNRDIKPFVKDSITNYKNIHINLSPKEDRLFKILEGAAVAYENGDINIDENSFSSSSNYKDNMQNIEIRIAGGWVRDKIIGDHNPHDVDVTLNCMTGHKFAKIILSYLSQWEGLEDYHSRKNEVIHTVNLNSKHNKFLKSSKIGIISANPLQSKHLETATMCILDINLDFVNLRSKEVYDNDSCIPNLNTRQFGTPLEDALRRDFTVNSLFYNIRKRCVEDYTRCGIRDLLQTRMLVTPLNPNVTFHDDPLRVLRAIRFGLGCNLNFHKDILTAASSTSVHRSLRNKISRERVGQELEEMLSGRDAIPYMALKWISELKLAGSVFMFPPLEHSRAIIGNLMGEKYLHHCGDDNDNAKRLRKMGWVESAEYVKILSYVLEVFISSIWEENRWIKSLLDHKILYLTVFLLPFKDLRYIDNKGTIVEVVTFMIKSGIKFKNKDVVMVAIIMKNINRMISLLRYTDFNNENFVICRLEVGLLLRDLKDLWLISLIVSSTAEIRANLLTRCNKYACNSKKETTTLTERKVIPLFHAIKHQNLHCCWKTAPFFDGKELMNYLGLRRGSIIGIYLEEQFKWMLLNPLGSKDDCGDFLKRKRNYELKVRKIKN